MTDRLDAYRPIISICVANYNGDAVIRNCLNSILNQIGHIPLEVIVHDDASTDKSVSIIEKEYPQVTLIKSPTNVGYCASNNRMAARAKGKYLLLLNNDATLLPDALQTLLCGAKKYGNSILTLPQYNASTGQLVDCGQYTDLFGNAILLQEIREQPVATVMGACLWTPLKLWRELGGFPDFFGSLAEDFYLCSKARLKAHPVISLGKSGYNHLVGYSFGGGKSVSEKLQTSRRRRHLTERNKIFTIMVCYPGIVPYLILPTLFVTLMMEGLTLSMIKRDFSLLRDIYIAAIDEFFKHFYTLKKLRRSTQKERLTSISLFFKPIKLFPQKLYLIFKYGIPTIH